MTMNIERHFVPKHYAVVIAQEHLLRSLPESSALFGRGNWADYFLHHCWACNLGDSDFLPSRAHIVAASKGGGNSPDNFFLLCDRCHDEQPDGLTPELQVEWLVSRQNWFDIYLPIAKAILDEMIASVNGATMDDVRDFKETCGGTFAEIIHCGYEKPGGWKNGRSNATWLLRQRFREFMTRKTAIQPGETDPGTRLRSNVCLTASTHPEMIQSKPRTDASSQ